MSSPVQPCEDGVTTRPPPMLDLVTGRSPDQCADHPFFDHFQRVDDITGLEGASMAASSFTPVDFLLIPDKVTTFRDAVATLRQADLLCTLTENQKEAIKFGALLKFALLQNVFTKVVDGGVEWSCLHFFVSWLVLSRSLSLSPSSLSVSHAYLLFEIFIPLVACQ